MPEGRYHPWLFGDETAVEKGTADMVDAIVEYGLPLMNETSQMTALLRALCNSLAATQEHVAY